MNDETTTRRCFRAQELRIEQEGDGPAKIVGLAVPWNAPSEDLGGFREVFKRGAFTESLDRDDVFADIEHEQTRKLGRTSAKTLDLTDTREGLRAVITVPDTTVGRDTLEEVRNGTLDGMSIAYSDPDAEWKNTAGQLTRTINKASLGAVTLTSFPAFTQTAGTLTLRSLADWRKSQEPDGPDTAELRRRLELEEASLDSPRARV